MHRPLMVARSSAIAGNVGGLLLRWHSMFLSPERQPNSEPKAEDKTKAEQRIFSPELQMNSEQKLMFIPSASDSSKPNVGLQGFKL